MPLYLGATEDDRLTSPYFEYMVRVHCVMGLAFPIFKMLICDLIEREGRLVCVRIIHKNQLKELMRFKI